MCKEIIIMIPSLCFQSSYSPPSSCPLLSGCRPPQAFSQHYGWWASVPESLHRLFPPQEHLPPCPTLGTSAHPFEWLVQRKIQQLPRKVKNQGQAWNYNLNRRWGLGENRRAVCWMWKPGLCDPKTCIFQPFSELHDVHKAWLMEKAWKRFQSLVLDCHIFFALIAVLVFALGLRVKKVK